MQRQYSSTLFTLLRILLCTLLLVTGLQNSIAAQSPPKKIYYIDSVFILKLERGDDNVLVKGDIATMRLITAPDTLQLLELINIDTVIYIITNAYAARTDSIRHIPTLKTLVSQENRFYLKDSSILPYSGPFLDYYLDGSLKTRGQIKEGYIDGYVNSYYRDGNMQASHYFSRSREDGVREEYYPNGSVKKRGKVTNGYMEGFWQEWHSTGKLKSEIRYLHSGPFYAPGEDIFYAILKNMPDMMEEERYSDALKKLDDCKKANPDIEEVYYYYGLAYMGKQQTEAAIKAFTTALSIEPLYMAALTQRAFATAVQLEAIKSADTTGITALQQSICSDLEEAIKLGEKKAIIRQLLLRYCKETIPAALQ
jgi:tetratricopeptide (TPR) repeat protein